MGSYVRSVDVVLVRWPSDEQALDLARKGAVPRLLLVEGGSPPPVVDDELEDWIRVPADEVDLHARVEALDRRLRARAATAPELDDDGVLRVGGAWVSLPPVEARLTGALLARLGAVVSRDALGRAGWPDGVPGRNALDVHVLRLRRRIQPLGLAIRTVRARGYLLEAASTNGH
jgi:two-component system OmpR family response regulator